MIHDARVIQFAVRVRLSARTGAGLAGLRSAITEFAVARNTTNLAAFKGTEAALGFSTGYAAAQNREWSQITSQP